MQKEHVDNIIKKFAENPYSVETRTKFYRWLADSNNKDEKNDSLSDVWNNIENKIEDNVLFELDKFHQRIDQQTETETKPNHRRIVLKFIRVAAVILFPLICLFSIYQIQENQNLKNVELTECFVENGDNKEIILPDGTKVQINSGSSIVFPSKFTGDTRTVFLNGEANFLVAKNEKQPFIVNTGYMSIEALGTVFNVQAYQDLSKSYATLEEGKIKVLTKSARPQEFILSPNEQIMYDHKTKEISKKIVDAQRFSSWKDGYLVFQSATFNEIVHSLSKRYDVVFQFDSGKYDMRTFTVRFTPENSVEEAMDIMKELIKGFKYKREENTVYIY